MDHITDLKNRVSLVMSHAKKLFPCCEDLDITVVIRKMPSSKIATSQYSSKILSFNVGCLNENPNHMIHSVVAHEVAHMIVSHLCSKRMLAIKQAHGPEWKKICIMLGGDGLTKCNISLYPSTCGKFNQVKKYEYRKPSGKMVYVSGKRHNFIKSGVRYVHQDESFGYSEFTGTVYLTKKRLIQ